jgi:Rha family phage regulatory protein
MSKLILNTEYGLYEQKGQALVSSRQIAETFRKRHDDVLKAIRNLECSTEFRLRNFTESYYKNLQNKKQPEYLITRDGFVLLAMGFTGKQAMAFKEAYIERFNQMEAFIRSLAAARMDFPAFTRAVLMAHDEPKPYHFSNEINMIYHIIFGMDAKQLRQMRGIEAGASVRPFLSAEEVKAVEALQRADIGLVLAVPDFQTRKDLLTKYYENLQINALSA